MNIQELHEQFCEYQIAFKGYSNLTIQGYKASLKIFRICYPNIDSIEQITEQEVQKFFYWGRTERKWSPTTFITYHKRLKVFFDYSISNGFVLKNLFDHIDKPRLPHRLPKAISKQQAQKVLDVALYKSAQTPFTLLRNHATYGLFLFAGLRKCEVLALSVDDVDLKNNRLSIRQSKGNKDRVVPISSTLHKILNRYIISRNNNNYFCKSFLVSSNTDKALTEHGLKHTQDNMLELVDFHFYFHQLRHTFATLMLEGGCNIYTLSKMLGHNDIKTTTIYLSASNELMLSEVYKHPLN